MLSVVIESVLMLRSREDSEKGDGHCKPGRERGFREELTYELDFKGEVEIEQVEKMGSTYFRW